MQRAEHSVRLRLVLAPVSYRLLGLAQQHHRHLLDLHRKHSLKLHHDLSCSRTTLLQHQCSMHRRYLIQCKLRSTKPPHRQAVNLCLSQHRVRQIKAVQVQQQREPQHPSEQQRK
jgi:hypothetical protein